jgi:hypothetical protein
VIVVGKARSSKARILRPDVSATGSAGTGWIPQELMPSACAVGSVRVRWHSIAFNRLIADLLGNHWKRRGVGK